MVMMMATEKTIRDKKHIMFIHSSDELYGSDVVLLQVVRHLDRKKFEPIVVLPSDVPYKGKLSIALDQMGIIHYSVKMGVIRRRYFNIVGLFHYISYFLVGAWKIRQLVFQHEIDLIHSNTSTILGGALIAKICRLPHVWHIHEILEKPAWLGQLIYWIILRNSTRVVAISQAVADHITKGKLEAKVVVIRNCVDTSKFLIKKDPSFRDILGIRNGEVAIGQIGRIAHWKGQELVIEAAARAIIKFPLLHFIFIGDPILGDAKRLVNLKAQALQLGLEKHISFLPFSENIPSLMQGLDILVLPSILPEPFGLVVLEAMASKLPVIASAHGGPLEIVVNYKTGLFFPPRDSDALAEAFVTLACDPNLRRKMGNAGHKRVLSEFSPERFNQQFNRLYCDLLN